MAEYPIVWNSTHTTVMIARVEDKPASRRWLIARSDRSTVIVHPGEAVVISAAKGVQFSVCQLDELEEITHAKLDGRTTSDL